MVPIGLLAPRFASSWGRLVGLLNGINRLGSVLNFLLEPLLLVFEQHRISRGWANSASMYSGSSGSITAHSLVLPSHAQAGPGGLGAALLVPSVLGMSMLPATLLARPPYSSATILAPGQT